MDAPEQELGGRSLARAALGGAEGRLGLGSGKWVRPWKWVPREGKRVGQNVGAAGGWEGEPQSVARRREKAPDPGTPEVTNLKSRTEPCAPPAARGWPPAAAPGRHAHGALLGGIRVRASTQRLAWPAAAPACCSWYRGCDSARPGCSGCGARSPPGRPASEPGPCRSRSVSSMVASFQQGHHRDGRAPGPRPALLAQAPTPERSPHDPTACLAPAEAGLSRSALGPPSPAPPQLWLTRRSWPSPAAAGGGQRADVGGGSFGSVPLLPCPGPAGRQVGLESAPPSATDSLIRSLSSLPPLPVPWVCLLKVLSPQCKGQALEHVVVGYRGAEKLCQKANVWPKGLRSPLPRPPAPQ